MTITNEAEARKIYLEQVRLDAEYHRLGEHQSVWRGYHPESKRPAHATAMMEEFNRISELRSAHMAALEAWANGGAQ